MSTLPFLARLGLAVAGLFAWGAAAAAQPALVQQGERVYNRWCVDCHGPGPGLMGLGLTGTAALDAKYQGQKPPVLDQRTDLTPELVAYFVRHGVSIMPFFRRTEISDPELTALGAYLSRLNPDLQGQRPAPSGTPR